MIISEECIKYLKGDEFDVGYLMRLEDNPLYRRTDILLKAVKGKSVLHIGCCDHLDLIEERLKTNQWLHGLLESNCNHVIGIDINQESVNYINEKNLTKNKVYCADVTSEDLPEIVPDCKDIDYVILGEILEHVDNPVYFLTKMRANLEKAGLRGGGISLLCRMLFPLSVAGD